MRVLSISAFFPPHVAGGWEQMIENETRSLRERGHETFVLTSRHGLDEPMTDADVARVLHLESNLQHYQPSSALRHAARLRENSALTEAIIDRFQPDVVFVQVLWNLSRAVPWIAEQRFPGRVVYYMAAIWAYPPDPRVAYWKDRATGPLRAAAKRLIAPAAVRSAAREHERFPLRFDHILCVSEASRRSVAAELARDPETIQVVPNGIEPELFYPRAEGERERAGHNWRILFAGTVAEHKGVHTVVEALALLPAELDGGRLTLTIAGSGHTAYEAALRTQVAELGLEDRVSFRGRVPREAMPSLMREFDVLVLPSIWEEPLARVMLEAMATGLVVVGTATGGTGEVLVHEQTGLVFPPADAAGLAGCLASLAADPARAAALARAGRERVLADFTFDRMMDAIERVLENVARNEP